MLFLKRFPKFITVALLAANFGATAVATEPQRDEERERPARREQEREEAAPMSDRTQAFLDFAARLEDLHREAVRIEEDTTEAYNQTNSDKFWGTSGPFENTQEQQAENQIAEEFGLGWWNTNMRGLEMARSRVKMAKKYMDAIGPIAEILKGIDEARIAILAAQSSTDAVVLEKAAVARATLGNLEADLESKLKILRGNTSRLVPAAQYEWDLHDPSPENDRAAVRWIFEQASETLADDNPFVAGSVDSNLTNLRNFPRQYQHVFNEFRHDVPQLTEHLDEQMADALEHIDQEIAVADRATRERLTVQRERLALAGGIVADYRNNRVDADTAQDAARLSNEDERERPVHGHQISSLEDIREFMPNFKVTVGTNGDVKVLGQADRRCLNQLHFDLGAYDAKNKVHPLMITQDVREGDRNFCTRAFYNQCRADRECQLVGSIGRVDKDGHVRLATENFGAGEENDAASYIELPGLEEAYLSPRSRIQKEAQDKKAAAEAEAKRLMDEILAKEEGRISAVCEAAVEGDRSAIDQLAAMGLDVTNILIQAQKSMIASLNKRVTDADSLAKLRKLIKEIEAAAKMFPEMKEQFADLLLQVKDAALAMESSDDDRKAVLGHGAETFKVARAALKAAKRIDKGNSEVRKALADLVLDETKFAANTGDTFYYYNVRSEAVRSYTDQMASAYRRQFFSPNSAAETMGNMTSIITSINQADREFAQAQKRTVEQEVESYKLLNPDRAPGTNPAPQPAPIVQPAPAPSAWPYTAVPGYQYNYNSQPVNYNGGNVRF